MDALRQGSWRQLWLRLGEKMDVKGQPVTCCPYLILPPVPTTTNAQKKEMACACEGLVYDLQGDILELALLFWLCSPDSESRMDSGRPSSVPLRYSSATVHHSHVLII